MKIQTSLAAAAALICLSQNLNAQNWEDMLRYSQHYNQSTAKSTAMGSAMGAVGADFSVLNINPAGVGLYRKPEFTMSFGLNRTSTNSVYLGSQATDDKFNLNMSNLGLVIANIKTDKNGAPLTKGWVSVNYALGFNRSNNFHNNTALDAINTSNSILKSGLQDVQGKYPSQFDPFSYGTLAYAAYLINPIDTAKGEYFDLTQREPYPYKLHQEDYISTRGSMNNINFSVAGNYANSFYIGGTVTMNTIGYHFQRDFRETNKGDSIHFYAASEYSSTINTSGVGISAMLGAIYRPNDNVRFGLSAQTPAFYRLSDEYYSTVTSNVIGYTTQPANSPLGSYKYNFTTPGRVIVSGAYLFSKSGMISADYEYVNYSSGRMSGGTAIEFNRKFNNDVRYTLKPASNLRLGGEYRVDRFAFRGGISMNGSPYKPGSTSANYNGAVNIYSAGLGYREESYFFDLTWQYLSSKSTYTPYTIPKEDVSSAELSMSRTNIIATIGSRF